MPSALAPRRAFTLAELLVVLGIMALLLALLLPALARARATSRSALCTSQLREVSHGFSLYANENQGYVPRDHTLWRHDRRPYWMLAIGPFLEGTSDWERDELDAAVGDKLLKEFSVFHCPEHPLAGEIPGTYVVNAFKFESAPVWDPDGPVRLARIRQPSSVIWIAEASDTFGRLSGVGFPDDIYRRDFHDAYMPAHLPGAGQSRITDRRHARATNILFFDGSVRKFREGEITLELFDDGNTQRATRGVLGGI